MHNPGFDTARNQYYGSHCTCPLEMNGPGTGDNPFYIHPFPHQPPRTVAFDIRMTPGKRVLLMKYIPPRNQIITYTGIMVGSPENRVGVGCWTRFRMNIDKLDDIRLADHGPHPILYYGTTAEARRIKTFAELAQLEFVGNV